MGRLQGEGRRVLGCLSSSHVLPQVFISNPYAVLRGVCMLLLSSIWAAALAAVVVQAMLRLVMLGVHSGFRPLPTCRMRV